MRRLLFTLMTVASLAGAVAAASTTVYKWVDEDGVVHYSDQPHPNAQKLQVEGVQTYKPTDLPFTGGGIPPAAVPPAADTGYKGCSIQQPAPDQTLENADQVTVSVSTDPGTHPGDQIFATLDGAPVNNGAATGNSFSLSSLDRGEHTLAAQVRDRTGQVLCQTPSVTFYVRMPSVTSPSNPVRPH
ncbi:MAG: DUF4124 domain-containing protein [Steroidobacteraceae bacterium]